MTATNGGSWAEYAYSPRAQNARTPSQRRRYYLALALQDALLLPYRIVGYVR